MSKKSLTKNYIFNASYQLLVLIVPLITTPYISRVLKASGIGIYSYTYSIVSYFTLFSILGTATYGNRLFGIIHDDIENCTKRFWDIFLLRVITSSVSLILYLIYTYFVAENKFIASIQCIYILAVMFDITWYFQGLEEFKKIAIRNYCIKLINIIYIFIVVKEASDLWKYVFGLAFFTFIGNISIWIYLPKYIVKLNKYRPRPFCDFKVILQLFIPSLAIQIYAMLDKSMIGWLTGIPDENGYYEQSEKIVKMCLMLITSLSTVMIPRISKAFSENKKDEFLNGIYKSYNFVWFLSIPLMFGLIGISSLLVPVFFGQGYEKVNLLLPVFSVLFVFMGLNTTTGSQYFITSGQQNIYTKIILIGGILNIALNFILIPKYYSLGAAIASVTGELLIVILGLFYIAKNKQFNISYVLKLSKKYIISGIIMFFYVILIKKFLAETFLNLFIVIFSSSILYLIALYLQKEYFVNEGISIVKRKFKIY